MFDSLIHLQDSQTTISEKETSFSLIHLFTYKTLKQGLQSTMGINSLIHLFTYKTLKLDKVRCSLIPRLIHLFTYKTLKPQIIKIGFSLSLTYGHML